MDTIMWDVDTQKDFMEEDGALYVDGAETIRDNLERITETAREEDLPILGSVDYHDPDDEELSDDPDFEDTFPPHCLADTGGQKKIEETRPEDPIWIDSDPVDRPELEERVESHDGEIYVRKQQFDVFSNPNTETLLDIVDPFQIAVYGVTLDVCVRKAVLGLLDLDYQVTVIEDATRALEESGRSELLFKWKNLGVQVVETDDALSGYVL
jgi:nicotinamidase/pyrazinamidase